MSFLHESGDYPGVVDIFLHDSARYLPYVRLLTEIMNGESELSKPEREMIAFYVSALNDCAYCVGSHRAVLVGLGVDEATIAAVETGSPADPRMGPALAFVAKLTKTPGAVTQADVDRVRGAGWSERAVEDMIGVASLFAFLNRLVDGFGVEGSAAGFAQTGDLVSRYGYAPLVKMMEEKASAASAVTPPA